MRNRIPPPAHARIRRLIRLAKNTASRLLIGFRWLNSGQQLYHTDEKCCADGLAGFSKESSFHGSIQGYLGDTEALLELYRASQVQMLEEEHILALGQLSC
jgi:hypothetical protein